VTSSERVLTDADSLFSAGNYLHAKMRYAKVLTSYPNTEWAEEAQYRLGFLNVYYANPFADWEAALREFTVYQSKYPNGRWISDVNSWLSILHSLQSYDQGFRARSTEAEKLATKHVYELRKAISLGDSLTRCENVRDSLGRKMEELYGRLKELEDFIIRLQ